VPFTDAGTGVEPPPLETPTQTVGTGARALLIRMTGNAYLDVDPKFTVRVDGVQIGGTLSVHAEKGTAEPADRIEVRGNWAPGSHTLRIHFTNNASGASGDRNLFVQSVSIDGVPVPNSARNFRQAGPQEVKFVV
jgi:hypothetical protein